MRALSSYNTMEERGRSRGCEAKRLRPRTRLEGATKMDGQFSGEHVTEWTPEKTKAEVEK